PRERTYSSDLGTSEPAVLPKDDFRDLVEEDCSAAHIPGGECRVEDGASVVGGLESSGVFEASISACRTALPFWTRRLCPRPTIFPSITRTESMGIPPSASPAGASAIAARRNASMSGLLSEGLQHWAFSAQS